MTSELIEQRIADALHARAGGITMDTSTLEQRFVELQERGAEQAARRRRTAVGAAVLATAAAVLAAFTLAGGLLRDDDEALPADRERAVIVQPGLVGSGTPEPGRTYSVLKFGVPFTFSLPETGDVPGRWHYETGDGQTFSVGLDMSMATGHASVALTAPPQVYDPEDPSAALVSAPADAEGWREWFESTGQVDITATEQVSVGGLPATRMSMTIGEDVPDAFGPCPPREKNRCLALGPDEFPLNGSSEVTVLELEDRTLLAIARGASDTRDQWLPLMRSVVDSLRFA